MIVDKVKNISNIFIGEYPFHKQLYDELVPMLENYPDRQGRLTNVKATMTEWVFDSGGDCVRLNALKTCLLNATSNGPLKHLTSGIPVYENFWGNIYRRGDYTQEHDHVYSAVSCVYFLKSPQRSSPLVFTYSGKKIQSKEGTYVLFPSHLKHHVPKHSSDETRITLSANFGLEEKE